MKTRREWVLIMEDRPYIVGWLTRLGKMEGWCEIVAPVSGADADEKLAVAERRRHIYQVVFADYDYWEGTTFDQYAERIHARTNEHSLIIVTSGDHSRLSHMLAALPNRTVVPLGKPYGPVDVLWILRKEQ